MQCELDLITPHQGRTSFLKGRMVSGCWGGFHEGACHRCVPGGQKTGESSVLQRIHNFLGSCLVSTNCLGRWDKGFPPCLQCTALGLGSGAVFRGRDRGGSQEGGRKRGPTQEQRANTWANFFSRVSMGLPRSVPWGMATAVLVADLRGTWLMFRLTDVTRIFQGRQSRRQGWGFPVPLCIPVTDGVGKSRRAEGRT